MNDISRFARRMLTALRPDTGEPVYPGYIAFDRARTRWWDDKLMKAAWGDVLGVHENHPNEKKHSFVVTTRGLVSLGDDTTWVPYTDVAAWEPLSKTPISDSLTIRTKHGESVTLRFARGGAFAFVQFLSGAIRRA